MRKATVTTTTLGSLHNRLLDIEKGIKKEPECKLIDDLTNFVLDARALGLGGTLMKAEKMLKRLESFLVDRYVRRDIISRIDNRILT